MNKKLKFLALLFCLSSGSIMAQSILVQISPKPSPYISDWQNRSETVKLIITNPSKKDIVVKIKTELFDGKGSLVANTDEAKMPVLTISATSTTTYNPEDIIPSNAVQYHGNLEKTAITTGRIPDDNYRLCVTLIDPQSGKPIGTSGTVCKMFSIVAYQAPTLIAPANKEVIKGAAIKGIVFRWSPVIPSPKTIVTYRLQVWEVLEGQNSMTALRSNQPIVEKDLKGILQTQWPVDFPLPDTGVNYVWTITPIDDEGRNWVDGLGFSEPFEFRACCWPPPLPPAPDDDDDIFTGVAQNPTDSLEIGIKITCTIARDGCTDRGGLCDCRLSLIPTPNPNDNNRIRDMQVKIKGDKMFVYFKDKLPHDASVFEFVKPVILDEKISTKLGFKQIIIQSGNYKVKKGKSGGRVILHVVTK
ncbi:MAG: hypothetical protein ACKVQB_03490 [Bacteroidia bacterium]